MKKILFRVDSSYDIGSGHIMRCLTLAQYLRNLRCECHFVMRNLDGALIDIVKANGFNTTILPTPIHEINSSNQLRHAHWLGVSQELDAEQTLKSIDHVQDWVICDHYGLDETWHTIIRPMTAHILVIDDIYDRYMNCDLLLNQNLLLDPNPYEKLVPSNCNLLMGPKFSILREEFSDPLDGAPPPPHLLPRVLVYMGGVDQPGTTLLALRALENISSIEFYVDVIVSDKNPHIDEVKLFCKNKYKFTVYVGHVNLKYLMLKATISIGAPGSTSWERCQMGLPTILISFADNQIPIAKALAHEGAGIYAGDAQNLSESNLSILISSLLLNGELRESIKARMKNLVDGKGVRRISNAMGIPEIQLKEAISSDIDMLYLWRNDPRTRQFFHNSQEIDLKSHREWFKKCQNDPDRILLIGYIDAKPIGVLRYDISGSIATISVYLNPDRKGSGEGGMLIKKGTEWLNKKYSNIDIIRAEILSGNHASISSFEFAGFTCRTLLYERIYSQEIKNG